MGTAFVLLVFMKVGYGNAAVSHTFHSAQACELAAKFYRDNATTFGSIGAAVCIPDIKERAQ